MTNVICRLTAKNRDQLPDPTLGNRVWATFTFLLENGTLSRRPSGSGTYPYRECFAVRPLDLTRERERRAFWVEAVDSAGNGDRPQCVVVDT